MVLPRAGSPGSTQGMDNITLSILTILLIIYSDTNFSKAFKSDTQVAYFENYRIKDPLHYFYP
jgi:hypothetical protein